VPPGNDFTAVSCGFHHSLALRENGSLVAWGENFLGQCNVPAGKDFTDISCGGFHNLALRENGSIAAWGFNNYGQCNAPAGNNFIEIEGGGLHSLAIRTTDPRPVPEFPIILTPVMTIMAASGIIIYSVKKRR
jgi:alpha-tubulin suppressor-like RCC1 family protein